MGEIDTPRTTKELLTSLALLEEQVDDRPDQLWDLRRRFYFKWLSAYEDQLKMDKENPKLANQLPLRHWMGKRLTANDAENVAAAAIIKKRIAARLKELKAKGQYRPTRVRLD